MEGEVRGGLGGGQACYLTVISELTFIIRNNKNVYIAIVHASHPRAHPQTNVRASRRSPVTRRCRTQCSPQPTAAYPHFVHMRCGHCRPGAACSAGGSVVTWRRLWTAGSHLVVAPLLSQPGSHVRVRAVASLWWLLVARIYD